MEMDYKSNAQPWELEVVCKNKAFLDAVVKAILKFGNLDFSVENIECTGTTPEWNAIYSVVISCVWFENLHKITKKLKKIEKKFQNFN